jgi:hypothetical protein
MALQTARATRTARTLRPLMATPPRKPGRPRKAPEQPEPGGIEQHNGAETVAPLKASTLRRIEAVRPAFKAHVTMFTHMDKKAGELAPDFMRAFRMWKAETEGSFVTFVRLFDDTVPVNRDPDPKDRQNQGYRAHSTYRAADYLRRLVPVEEGEREESDERAGPLSVSVAFVRLLAAIVALIPGNQVEKLWEVIGTELQWSERKVSTLREEVEEVEPLVEAKAERGHLAVESVH